MTMEMELRKYRDLLLRRAEARKIEIELDVEIQVWEKRFQLTAMMIGGNAELAKPSSFIERHLSQLEPEDIEFLSHDYRGTGEVTRHTGISASTLKRLAAAGKIEFRKTSSGQYRYQTESVIEYLINGKASEKT